MNRGIFALAFTSGAAVVVWVGAGFAVSNALALVMTLIISAVYLLGALEIVDFRRATASLAEALAAVPEQLSSLADWLGRLPPSLQNPVRLRIEGERVGLPGPALTPYLVGLLVMLGMLGTFLGMVVTLDGAVAALHATTDLPAIRAELAAPIKGLGLAFGTSVAGVAASAMLGLMSALSRRERALAAQLLDTRIATSALRAFSLTHQRQETLRALQLQAQALPAVADKLQALIEQIEQRERQSNERLIAGQERFHAEASDAYRGLAQSVAESLAASLDESARRAGENLKPAVEAAMAEIARETKLLYEGVIGATQAQLDKLATRLGDTAERAAVTWSELIAQLRQEMSSSLARDNQLLEERARIMQTLESLLLAIEHASSEQRAAIDSLVASSATLLGNAGSRFADEVDAGSARLAEVAAQVTGSAVEVASLSEAFGLAVQSFGEANEKLVAHLQTIEAAIGQSTARSDEQLAYYVAQAREIIDLSIMAQERVIAELRQIGDATAHPAGQRS
jgi:hypothetical protein